MSPPDTKDRAQRALLPLFCRRLEPRGCAAWSRPHVCAAAVARQPGAERSGAGRCCSARVGQGRAGPGRAEPSGKGAGGDALAAAALPAGSTGAASPPPPAFKTPRAPAGLGLRAPFPPPRGRCRKAGRSILARSPSARSPWTSTWPPWGCAVSSRPKMPLVSFGLFQSR